MDHTHDPCASEHDREYGTSPEDAWSLIASYFEGQHLDRLVRHQIESYNDFVQCQIPRTIAMFNPVRIRSEQDYSREHDKYRLEMWVTFTDFAVLRPQIHENNGALKLMFPQEARLRNFTYASAMTVDMHCKYVVRTGDNLESEQTMYKMLPKVHIGKLPLMIGSCICVLQQYRHVPQDLNGECSMDAGGYFIINGSEKTCIAQERAAENTVTCFDTSKNSSKWSWTAEIKSVPDFKCISPKQLSMTVSSRNNGFGHGLWVQLPRLRGPIPLFVLFRAMGVISDADICEMVVLGLEDSDMTQFVDALRGSVYEANDYVTQEAAMEHVTDQVVFTPMNMDKEAGARRKREFAEDVLANDLFPHCNAREEKTYFLGYMALRLLRCFLGVDSADDRDSYLNKRLDLTGSLLNNLFRNYFNKLVKDMQKQIVREINGGSWRSTEDYVSIVNFTNVYKIVKSTTLENGLKRALSTGDFGIKHCANSSKVGVAQVLKRLTYLDSLSHLRRVNTPIDKSGKLIPPRKLHGTSWGYICPAETPEGGSVGVVKNLSYMTHVTIPCSSAAVRDYVAPFVVGLTESNPSSLHGGVKVFINGAWIGNASEPARLYADLKMKKAKGIINVYTSIVFDLRRLEVRVCDDAGRITRPLLRVRDNRLLVSGWHVHELRNGRLSWDDLLTDCRIPEAVVEYIDPAEQNFGMLAMTPDALSGGSENCLRRYTHCEIHPSTIFGILASCIPFPEHNQSPRNTYQCAMGKQAMGMFATNFDSRLDKTAYVLTYPMRPLVETRIMNLIQLNRVPSGSQVVVGIMTHTGYNQEDSILFNKGSIDRGLFQATIYHTEKDEDKKIHGDEEIRCRPDPAKTKGMKFGNYDKVNAQGVVPEDTRIQARDVIISKVQPIKEARNDPTKVMKFNDQSRLYRGREDAFVDKNYTERNGDGYNFCKVRLRTVRKPVIGDKFSSRHGQKGTIGNIIPEADMPYMDNGMRPDILINPHAIPSRMTIAQLKETLLGKALLELGLFGDGTSFGQLEIKDICDELVRLGYESTGNELLYDGLTGRQIDTSIFVGPAFYQRLKHMVNDKQHSRSVGPMVNLTRQPAEGRSRDGGLRYGEMERDCMCSHGASRFNKGRIYDASDAFEVHVCRACGMLAAYNNECHVHHCRTCDNRSDFDRVELPYACKLMFQELITMNVAPRILTR
jgi:DNA-directed RNA polymerase II subunit RPB2